MIPTLSEIAPHLLCELEESELISLLKHISKGFTSERTRIGEYVGLEKQVSAYATYFLPTNIPKLHFLLRQLDEDILKELGQLPLMDVGCGPGTYSLGWTSAFANAREIVLVDRSELMLKQAGKLLRAFASDDLRAEFLSSVPSDRGGVLLFGNSLNEMGAKEGYQIISKVKPEYIFLIEPGTKSSFAEILQLREKLIQEGHFPLYPCPTNAACPLQGVDDWCHQVLRMTHESELERISQMAQLDRKIMPFIGHVYAKRKLVKAVSASAHFLRFLNETKYSFLWQVCLKNEEGKLILEKFEIMKKDYPKSVVKILERASVGESFRFEILRDLEQGKRVKLLSFGEEDLST